MQTASAILRVAMWSGPRNISTAMMRAWENRADTFVTDEPFYAHYLHHTGIDHPGSEETIKSQSTDWREVANDCVSKTHTDCSVHYQKHMTHHMLAHIKLDWLSELKNIFLIRSPESVVASYSKSRPELNAADLGFEQQHRLFKHVCEYIDSNPFVINSVDLLQKPEQALKRICQHCDIEFDAKMLQWPAGKRESDGAWAPYWYHNVERSTGFTAPKPASDIVLDDELQKIAAQCQPYYDLLAAHAVSL